jgi:predicted DNA-binding transcriptional regulator AlpA
MQKYGLQSKQLIKQNKKETIEPNQNDLLTLDETMKLLNMSKSTIDRRRFEGMPANKVGKKLYFSKSKINEWIKNN